MLEQAPAPVVPVAIGRMWGSAFSRKHQSWIKRLPLWDFGRPVFVRVGEPVPPQALDMDDLRGKVAELLGEQRQLSA